MMGEFDDPGEPMELVMPFIACVSNGGTYEDAAYVAGYEAGSIDRALAGIAALGGYQHGPITIHTANVAQLDLIAMRHGFKGTEAMLEAYPEWTEWTAVRDS